MPKRLAVLIILTFVPIVKKVSSFFKNYKRKNWKSDLGSICFGILWISLFLWLLTGIIMYFI